MRSSTTDELLDAVSELRNLFPEWRLGQLFGNLAMAAGCEPLESVWDVEDDRLLIATQRLIERNQNRADG